MCDIHLLDGNKLALSVAAATYGALLGAVVLSGPVGRSVAGRDVILGAAVSVASMLVVVASTRLSFLWTLPAGTALCVFVAWAGAAWRRRAARA